MLRLCYGLLQVLVQDTRDGAAAATERTIEIATETVRRLRGAMFHLSLQRARVSFLDVARSLFIVTELS